ncbi:hypothetical protein M5V91_08555 [Cytobacillus pseudoceanisediminis]|uniref:hypothetical protein n=1 Tax=Cytobacillus pseudoceanisediminis TaxID=3051614 RepID=UPI002187D6E2|nr:hypothetical protein [Cytobacillus pseudoceanisediminis]UQX55691.1 hypothetical protein M5V91_08555 [Cytobacillus pseudoceanisediminis]
MSPKSVTIRTGKAKIGGTSPKSVPIRTGKTEIRKYESEVSNHSDRRSGRLEVQVRSRHPFGQKKG